MQQSHAFVLRFRSFASIPHDTFRAHAQGPLFRFTRRPTEELLIFLVVKMNPRLPPELIHLIIKASLDPHDPIHDSCHLQRYSTLRYFSGVNSEWFDFSDPLLYEFVVITSQDAAMAFLDLCAVNGGTMKGVRSMKVSPTIRCLNEGILGMLLKSVPLARTLELRGIEVDWSDLAPLQHLERLFMFSTIVHSSSPTTASPLPRLRHLHTHRVDFSRSADHFLVPSFLPRLRAWSFLPPNTPSRPLEPLFPQLHAVSLAYMNDCELFLPHATSLQLLDIDSLSQQREISSFLGATLRFIRLRVAEGEEEAANELLDEHIAGSKSELETMFLDAPSGMGGEVSESQRVGALREKGVEVVKGAIGFWDAVERMERIMSREGEE